MSTISDSNTLVTYDPWLSIVVEPKRAQFSAWYEFFPRSFGINGAHGTWRDAQEILPEIARLGFDVIYLPPIHPIGLTNRKGKNNSNTASDEDPGSPWAIGSPVGGHTAIHPQLGSMDEFMQFVRRAKTLNMDVALDIAFQCSPDHPYVKEHPQWFIWRPDGTIQYAENPPKKYEDVYPLNFDTDDWQALWIEMKNIFVFWITKRITIFRVDNPHTKPFGFWKWVIAEIRRDHPSVIFLSEAFTRPHVMNQLAKIGFNQSYTYFTWRTTKSELTQYMKELTQTQLRDYFIPNFWPNTPDILPYHLQQGGRSGFIIRFVLASTLSSNYGIYGPAFELCATEAIAGKEEYTNSEKYELKQWDWDRPGNLKDLIARINQIRKENKALQSTWNIKFGDINNDNILCYIKATADFTNIIVVVVNLDSFHTQSGWVRIPIQELGIGYDQPYKMIDLVSHNEYTWQKEWNYVELNPYILPMHIFRLQKI